MTRLPAASLATSLLLVAAMMPLGCEPFARIGANDREPPPPPRLPNGPIDLLFVVDNSGSMQEEQEALARSIYRDDCPILDLTAVPAALLNPEPGLLEQLSDLCGISQILAAYDRDFRVGVITTDVNACDNLLELDSTEHRPQRGCLQPVPSTGEKIIERTDTDVIRKFRELMAGLGTKGSPVERGLDAVDLFLQGDDVAPGCEGDRGLFLREDAELLLLFVSDEDDCSHDGQSPDLPTSSDVCGVDVPWYSSLRPGSCYGKPELLRGVDEYVARFRTLKGEGREDMVRAVVVGGAVPDGDRFSAHGCRAEGSDIREACWESGGLSNFTDPGSVCGDDNAAARDFLPCCTADAANRYFELAERMGGQGASICADDYVADLVRFLDLTEER